MKTEQLEEIYCSLEPSKSPISALSWKNLNITQPQLTDQMEVHFKPLSQIDSKPSEAVKELSKLCQKMQTELSVLAAVDSAGILTLLYCGIFPVAKIDLTKMLGTKDITCTKIELNEDCTEVVILGKEPRGQFVLRLDTAAVSSLVFKNELAPPFLRTLPQLEHYLNFIDKQTACCKREWQKFYSKYMANMRVLIEKV